MPTAHANYFLNKHCIDPVTQRIDVPIDPTAIAVAEGLEVRPLPKDRLDLSGEIIPKEKIIMFNPNEPYTRQRFMIAHELGHYALHHEIAFRDLKHTSWLYNYDLKEVLANKFASALLMPERVIKALIEGEGITDADKLCSLLGVSLETLEIRLKNLGFA